MQKGFVAVTTVLVIVSVILAVSTSIALLSVGEAQSSLVLFKGEDNLTLIEGCVEDMMLKVRSNSSFASGTISRPEGTCTITVNAGNPNWDVTVTSQTTTYQRKIQVKFTKGSSGLTLTSWKEI